MKKKKRMLRGKKNYSKRLIIGLFILGLVVFLFVVNEDIVREFIQKQKIISINNFEKGFLVGYQRDIINWLFNIGEDSELEGELYSGGIYGAGDSEDEPMIFGINYMSLTLNYASHIPAGEVHLQMIEDAGFEYLRVHYSWDSIELTEGNYDWSNLDAFYNSLGKFDLKAYPILWITPEWASSAPLGTSDADKIWYAPSDINKWEEFVEISVQRYGHNGDFWVNHIDPEFHPGGSKYKPVEYWEIWNEQNYPMFFRSDYADYINLLETASSRIREIDPQAEILHGAIAGCLDFYNAETEALDFLNNYDSSFDIFNPHHYTAHPCGGSGQYLTFNEFIDMNKGYVQDTNSNKDIWFTEIGVADYEGDEFETARRVIKYNVLGIEKELGAIFWALFRFVGANSFCESSEGHDDWSECLTLIYEDNTKKPAYYSYQTLTNKIKGYSSVEKLEEGQYRFDFDDKRSVYVVWSDTGVQDLNPEIIGNLKVTSMLGEINFNDANNIQADYDPVYLEEVCNNDRVCNNEETEASCPGDCDTFRMGIAESISYNNEFYGWSIDEQIEELAEFNPEIARVWMSIDWCIDKVGDSFVINEVGCAIFKQEVAGLQAQGITVVAMHDGFSPEVTGIDPATEPVFGRGTIPLRDMTPGSDYQTFLNNYETAWNLLADYFPEIKYWETGNEPNVYPFLKGEGSHYFNFQEKVDITTDLMYRSNKGIKRANSNAFIFMPGLAAVDQNDQLDLDAVKYFVEGLYQNIESGNWPSSNSRDYFDGACWHPYYFEFVNPDWVQLQPDQTWVDYNNNIYQVFVNHGDNIPVLFSEFGFTDYLDESQWDTYSSWATSTLQLSEDNFPWLWGMTWFRLLNDPNLDPAVWGDLAEMFGGYGIMKSPESNYVWKPIAYVFDSYMNDCPSVCSEGERCVEGDCLAQEGDLIAHYSFEGNANDVSGNGNDGTLIGDANIEGGVLILDGEGDYVEISDSNSLDLPNAWTISSWVYVDPSQNDMGHIISKRGITGTNYALRAGYQGSLWDSYFYKGDWRGAWNMIEVRKGEWHQVLTTYNGIDTITIYQDGNIIGSNMEVGTPSSINNEKVIIGGFLEGGVGRELLKGKLDDVKIWNYDLSDSEVKGEYYQDNRNIPAFLTIESNSDIQELDFTSTYDAITEIPPWMINGVSGRGYFVTTAKSYFCSNPNNLLIEPVVNDNCNLAAQGESIYSFQNQVEILYETAWKRNYYGVYSTHLINNEIITINHAENKNEDYFGVKYQNTINADISVDDCYSGVHPGGTYSDCFEAYNGFLGMTWIPYTSQTNYGLTGDFNDEGPIIWPSMGYLDSSGNKVSYGLRSPSSIIHDGYIYVYYLDTAYAGIQESAGKRSGIKVARAPVSSGGRPGSFMNYYAGSFNQPSLPSGFNKENIYDYLDEPGPLADVVLGDWESIRFSVAKISGTDYFLGVEVRYDASNSNLHGVYLRISKDLVQWSEPVLIDNTLAYEWYNQEMQYPIFIDEGALTNSEINPDNFYILGTSTNSELNKIQLNINFCGDGVCDGDETSENCQEDCSECVPSLETCDGLDNDCDSLVDEELIRATNCGIGECLGNVGVESCTLGVWGGDTCNPLEGALSDDNCEGLDNDCDDSVDEGYVPSPTSCGVGECNSAGLLQCISGVEVDSCVEGTPDEEICGELLDEDCDGIIDNGCDCTNGETMQCGSSDVGVCEYGLQTCVDGGWGGCVGNVELSVEICDGLDNDCDGSVDEGGDSLCVGDVGCTDNVCSNGQCFFTENHNNCANELFCDGDEICSINNGGCINQNVPDCSDVYSCTDDSCDESSNICINIENDANCGNNNYCDINLFTGTGCGNLNNCIDSDNDGYLDYDSVLCPNGKDLAPYTNASYFMDNPGAVNLYSPIKDYFNISEINKTNIMKHNNFFIEYNESKIVFNEIISLVKINETGGFERLNLTKFIRIEDELVFLNSSYFPEFNKSANITILGINYTNPNIHKDGVECADCNIINYTKGSFLKFSVTGFISYDVQGGTYCGDGVCNNGESCSSCSGDCGACGEDNNDNNNGGPTTPPVIINCTERWSCTGWSNCTNGNKTRTCNDLNNCNIADRTPKLETKCGVEEEPGEIMEEEPNKVIYPQVIFYFFIGLLVIGIIIVLFILIFKGKGIVEKQ